MFHKLALLLPLTFQLHLKRWNKLMGSCSHLLFVRSVWLSTWSGNWIWSSTNFRLSLTDSCHTVFCVRTCMTLSIVISSFSALFDGITGSFHGIFQGQFLIYFLKCLCILFIFVEEFAETWLRSHSSVCHFMGIHQSTRSSCWHGLQALADLRFLGGSHALLLGDVTSGTGKWFRSHCCCKGDCIGLITRRVCASEESLSLAIHCF